MQLTAKWRGIVISIKRRWLGKVAFVGNAYLDTPFGGFLHEILAAGTLQNIFVLGSHIDAKQGNFTGSRPDGHRQHVGKRRCEEKPSVLLDKLFNRKSERIGNQTGVLHVDRKGLLLQPFHILRTIGGSFRPQEIAVNLKPRIYLGNNAVGVSWRASPDGPFGVLEWGQIAGRGSGS